jgi:hypothetical protein
MGWTWLVVVDLALQEKGTTIFLYSTPHL